MGAKKIKETPESQLKLYAGQSRAKLKRVDTVVLVDQKFKKKYILAQAVKDYEDVCTELKCEKNRKIEKYYFQIFLNFMTNEKIKFIHEVKPIHTEKFEALLLKRMSAASVNRRFNTFKHFFNKCVEWGYLGESPCRYLKKRREEFNPHRPWPYDFFLSFLKHFKGSQVINIRRAFLFMWLTGCRPVELRRFVWTDINYDTGFITLRCGKNGSISRLFPITRELDQLLHSMRVDGLYVFTHNREPMSDSLLYSRCREVLKMMNATEYTPYGLRHSFGTKLMNSGSSDTTIATLMGHKKLETTRRYLHFAKKHLIKALSKVK